MPATTAPWTWDERRGADAMLWFILTEAMLFVSLFFSYFLLASANRTWPPDPPPKLGLALAMLAILVASSVTLEVARHFSKRGRETTARLFTVVTIVLGLGFVGVQVAEFRERLKELLPTTDAYGSIFYTITSIHGAHVILGLLMLAWVSTLPHLGPGSSRSPHRPLHAASLYWHFVDGAWVVIVLLLYLLPQRG